MWVGLMASLIGSNTSFCCRKFGLAHATSSTRHLFRLCSFVDASFHNLDACDAVPRTLQSSFVCVEFLLLGLDVAELHQFCMYFVL